MHLQHFFAKNAVKASAEAVPNSDPRPAPSSFNFQKFAAVQKQRAYLLKSGLFTGLDTGLFLSISRFNPSHLRFSIFIERLSPIPLRIGRLFIVCALPRGHSPSQAGQKACWLFVSCTASTNTVMQGSHQQGMPQ